MALTSRVDENRALRTCMQTFCEPADKIDRLTLIHLRLLMHVKKMQKVNIANYEFISTCLFFRFSKGHEATFNAATPALRARAFH